MQICLIDKEELYLIVPSDHRLSEIEEINLIEISEEPFISFKHNTALRDVVDKLCATAGFEPNIVFEGLEERTVVDLVEAGFGIALVPIIPNLDENEVSFIRINNPQSFRKIYMDWKEIGYIPSAVTAFENFVLEEVN